MTTSAKLSARPAKPGIWIVLLFVCFCGMTFSSSAEEQAVKLAATSVGSSAGDAAVSLLDAAVPFQTWSLFDDNSAGESASLAFLGFSLIGAAGCWRRVIRRRDRSLATVTAARRPHLRAVSRLATSD